MSQLTDFKYDSDEELYFAYWLVELEKVGFIESWFRHISPIPVTAGLPHEWTKVTELKTKTKKELKKQWILEPSEYTPDFDVTWTPEAQDILFQRLEDDTRITAPFIAHRFQSTVEIKASFDRHNMTRSFINNQKFLWDKYRIFVNLIKLEDLFNKTFTPQARLYKKNGEPRKITKWTVRTLSEYLETIKK